MQCTASIASHKLLIGGGSDDSSTSYFEIYRGSALQLDAGDCPTASRIDILRRASVGLLHLMPGPSEFEDQDGGRTQMGSHLHCPSHHNGASDGHCGDAEHRSDCPDHLPDRIRIIGELPWSITYSSAELPHFCDGVLRVIFCIIL